MRIKYLRRLLDEKKLSCSELARETLRYAQEQNDTLNAFVTFTGSLALEKARQADERLKANAPLGVLDGIPMSLKDNICTCGVATTCCSEMLKGFIPPYNAHVAEKLKGQGAVLLGKTNMDEFAMGSTCATSVFGGAKTPYDTKCISGGSSGGSAAAVAAGLGAYSIGSDTGGSIRQPAAFCGAVGFKPTYGCVSRFGLIALAPGFDQIGPITSCVEDAALVFDAINSHDKRDERCRGDIIREPVAPSLAPETDLVIGIADELFESADNDVSEGVMSAVKLLEQHGAKVKKVTLPYVQYSTQVYCVLASAQISTNMGRFDGIRYGERSSVYSDPDSLMTASRTEFLGDEVKRRIMMGTFVLSADGRSKYYRKAQRVRLAIESSFTTALTQCDIIISPTAPTTAFKADTDRDFIEIYKSDVYTAGVNLAGLPAVSIPCGFDKKGLPIGLQIIGRAFDERTILAAALAFEGLTDGAFISKKGAVI